MTQSPASVETWQFSLRGLLVAIAGIALFCLALVYLDGPIQLDTLLLLAAAGLTVQAVRRQRWLLLVFIGMPPFLIVLSNVPRLVDAGYDSTSREAKELLWSAGMAGLLLGVVAAACVWACTARSRWPWQPVVLLLVMLAALGLYGWSEWHYQRPEIDVRIPPTGFGGPSSTELRLQSRRGRGGARVYWFGVDVPFSKPHPAGDYWGYGGGVKLAGFELDYLRGRKSDVDVIFGPHLNIIIPYWLVGAGCLALLVTWWNARSRARRAAAA